MKRRKRKIKIPAAQYGLNGSTLTTSEQQNMNYMQSLLNNSYQTPMQQFINSNGAISKQIEDFQAQANINNQVNANRLDAISFLNAPIKEATGTTTSAGNIAKGVSAAGDLIMGGIDAVQNSQHETKGQSAVSALSSAAKMASAGAALGSVIPGVGTLIGAGVGAAAGVITSGLTKGKKAKMTSFTDYDPGKQAGFLRPGRRQAINDSREHVKKNAYDNRSAIRGTANLLADYNLQYGDMNTNTFAYGGMPSSLAYVDDGELISTPDGSVTKVPEEGKPTDSNLVDLPVGSRILSDKLKVPGTKKTFAQLGEEMMATKKSKFNDIYAQNAAKLNEMNNKNIHNQLFEIQERVKAKRNIKPKSKDLPAYAYGGDKENHFLSELRKTGRGIKQDLGMLPKNPPTVDLVMDDIDYTVPDVEPTTITIQPATRKNTSSRTNSTNNRGINPWSYGDNFKYLRNGVYDEGYLDFINNGLTQDMIDQALREVPDTFSRFRSSNPNYRPTVADARKWATDFKPSDFHRFAQYVYENSNRLGLPENVDLPELTMAGLPEFKGVGINAPTPSKVKSQPIKTKPVKNQNSVSKSINIPDLTQIGSGLASLMPIISNLNTKPEYQDPNYNPYANAILNTMRNRRYNINPVLRDIERNRAITNYDASQMNTNTGANLAFRLQNAVNTNRAIADIRAQESNINNAYLSEYANMLNDLGRQWAAETTRVDDANMANRAAARNIRRAGLSGISQWFQNRELMNNQRERDNAMLELYRDFLSQGFTDNIMSNWDKYIRRGGNR